MATRFYPSIKCLNDIIRGPARGTWARQSVYSGSWYPDQPLWELRDTKTGSGTQSTVAIATNQQNNYDILWATWVSQELDAQTISGTFDLCFGTNAYWDEDPNLPTGDSIVYYKVHIYITVGKSKTVRHTLLNNYVDATAIPYRGGETLYTFQSLTSPAALTSGAAQTGDTLVVEVGFRVASSPTPAPTYPPSATTRIKVTSLGADAGNADAVAGDTTIHAPWFEFSGTIGLQGSGSSPPPNDACADAEVIASLPYTSGLVDTTESQDTDRAIWYTFTAAQDGIVTVAAHGSNYRVEIVLFDSCGGFATPALESSTTFTAPRSLALRTVQVYQGNSYWIRARSTSSTTCASNSGGVARISVFYHELPALGDVYLPSGSIFALRDDQYVNMTNSFITSNPTGVAIDYTQRPMDDLNGGTNSNERILIGLHSYELVEILDLPSLNVGESEVDYIGDPWVVGGVDIHPAQLYVTAAGYLHAGWFGNGYLFVVGAGTLPAILNTVSSNSAYSALKSIDATSGDNQIGAPYTDTVRVLDIQVTAPWAIAFDENSGILYYTSGGVYEPVGGNTIKRYSINTDTQLPDFATLALQGSNNPGLKGLAVLSTGGLLVCNGTVVQRLDNAGNITQTYTPSIAEDSQTLIDVKLDSTETTFWVVDLATTRLFQFNLATGAELQTVQPYGIMGTLVQLAVYTAGEAPPPGNGTIEIIKETFPPDDPTLFDVTVGGGLTPPTFQISDGGSVIYTDVPVGDGYSVDETPIAGWAIQYDVSNGSPVNNISVTTGETVVVTITNTRNLGGIYILVPGKRNDTIWTSFNPLTDEDVKIPDPFARTALLGE